MGALQATNPPATTYRVWLWRNSGTQSILHSCTQIRDALSCAQGHGAHMRVDCWCACILGHLRANHGRAASYKPTSHNLQSMTVKKLWNTKYLTLMRADSGRAVMRARSRRACARRLLARMHSWPPAHKSWARCKLQTHQPQLYRIWLWRKSGTQSILHSCAQDSGRAVMRARSRRAYARRLLARMHSWPPARKSWARCKLQTHQPQLTEYDCEETLEHKVSYTHERPMRWQRGVLRTTPGYGSLALNSFDVGAYRKAFGEACLIDVGQSIQSTFDIHSMLILMKHQKKLHLCPFGQDS